MWKYICWIVHSLTARPFRSCNIIVHCNIYLGYYRCTTLWCIVPKLIPAFRSTMYWCPVIPYCDVECRTLKHHSEAVTPLYDVQCTGVRYTILCCRVGHTYTRPIQNLFQQTSLIQDSLHCWQFPKYPRHSHSKHIRHSHASANSEKYKHTQTHWN